MKTTSPNNEVRKFLVSEQRKIGKSGGLIAEGRDIGSKVFPNAEIKLYVVNGSIGFLPCRTSGQAHKSQCFFSIRFISFIISILTFVLSN